MIKNTNNKFLKYFLTGLFIVLFSTQFKTAKAQEISTGIDLYSTYVYRGVAYSGPALQPYVELSSGGFALGAWGSQPFNGEGQEMDLYAAYTFDFGFSLGVTDYYYPPAMWLDGDSHAIELNAGYSSGGFSIAGNYIFSEGNVSAGDDTYFEVGYSTDAVDLFVGAGDGWHSSDGDFALVNIGIGTSKDIEITDSFSLPVSGSVILNPDMEQLFIVVGLSL